jgi:hypothetical protein
MVSERELLKREIKILKEVLAYKKREETGYGLDPVDQVESKIRIPLEYRHWVEMKTDQEVQDQIERLEGDLEQLESSFEWGK